MLGVGIWVTTQETEYKHLAGNKVSLICYFHASGKRNKIWVKQCSTRILGFVGAVWVRLYMGNKRKSQPNIKFFNLTQNTPPPQASNPSPPSDRP